MDCIDNLTNLVCIHDLNSIPFTHVQHSSLQDSHPVQILRSIEAKWRREGALVSLDARKNGLYIFSSTKDGDPYDKIKSTSTISHDGSIKIDGQSLIVESQGLYECNALLGRPRVSPATSSTYMPRSKSSPQGSDNIVRAAQALNARAAQSNMLLTPKQDSISSPNTSDSTTRDASPSKLLHEAFMASVLGLLAGHLCTDHGYTPLNATTLLAPSPTSDESYLSSGALNPISMVSLDLQLTAIGNLVLRVVSSIPTGLANISQNAKDSDTYKGTTVWLVPGGCVAAYMGIESGDSQSDHSGAPGKDIQLHQPASTQNDWKDRCISWLCEKGVAEKVLEDCSWSTVIIETCSWPTSDEMPQLNNGDNDRVSVLWPTSLCFYRPFLEKSQPSKKGSGTARLLTNSSGSINLAEDPLAFAENWSTEKSERDSTIVKRQKDREVNDAVIKSQVDSDGKTAGSSALSPVALRRSSVNLGVYPTPPDAIHHTTGATPSMDGTVSTPNANQATPANPRDPPSAVKDETTYTVADAWDSSQMEDVNNAMTLEENSNDNLFDDMGGDLFGDTDITDADFNFFDEPDAAQNDLSDYLPDSSVADQNTDTKMLGTEETSGIPEPSVAENAIEEKASDIVVATNDGTSAPQDLRIEDASKEVEEQKSPLPSPAFDRDFVFSRIVPDSEQPKLGGFAAPPLYSDRSLKFRRISTYEKVAFKPSLSFESKYKESGPFQGILAIRGSRRKPPTQLPVTGFLDKSKSRSRSISEFLEPAEPVDLTVGGSPNGMYGDRPTLANDSDMSQADPGQLVLSNTQQHAGVKRKHEEETDSRNASPKEMVAAQDKPTDGSITPNEKIFESLDANPGDWSLAKFYSHPQPSSTAPISLGNSNFIAAAQILADQAATWSSQRSSALSDWPFPTEKEQSEFDSYAVKSQQDLSAVTKKLFQDAKECTFAEVIDIKDLPTPTQPTKIMPRLNPPKQKLPDGSDQAEIEKKNPLIPMPMSHLDLRRADSKMTVLPSALPFWENLALSPSSKEKDVTALCIYPNADGMLANIKALFERLRSAYESCRLGAHEVLEGTGQTTAQIPLAPGAFEQLSNMDTNPGILQKFCTALGKQLAAIPLQSRNIVIYFVCPSGSENAPLVICQAFHTLFEAYRQTLVQKKMKPQTELVLQIIPSNFVASETEMIIPTPKEYTRLAMEVYDRCMNFKTMSKSAAVVLEQPLPKNLGFKVSMTPFTSLMDENSCIHIAYTQSIDERWITAAWTDNIGVQQMTASYCLGRRNEPLTRSFSEVANEIWETTLDVIRAKKINWRIMIVKSGVMQQFEIDFWSDLASTEMHASVTLTLLTVSTKPSLSLLPPSIILPPNGLSAQAMTLTTPVSTPQPNILSPDQFGNATTPVRDGITSAATPEATPVELDTDATLVDITDQTWAAILSMRLNNSNSVLDIAPALISGYLIKRSGPHASDVPVVMEVNIVHIDAKDGMRSARGLEIVLKEIMGYYKGLGSLARARCLVDQFVDARPWHVAAAEKALKVLYMLL